MFSLHIDTRAAQYEENISNCDYFDWYCDMIHNIGGNDHICIIILILVEEYSNFKIVIIVVWFLQGFIPNKDFFVFYFFGGFSLYSWEWIDRKGGEREGGDTQQRTAGRILTWAAAKDPCRLTTWGAHSTGWARGCPTKIFVFSL